MMGSQPAIVVSHVWKKFRRGEQHDSLRDLLPALLRGLRSPGAAKPSSESREFWAVHDVDFELFPGEALGIIGPNGAGKSTMLKLLNRILRPDRGRIEMTGRVAALIEVSAGFHPDLTGRENIFLQGAVMGMKGVEMRGQLDSIIDFSGIEAFIDTPVKRYSSGMNARLGFSIAAHLKPDIMLIDEVLSVGDAQFQAKCLSRMREFRRSGVAIVFVSHNLQAVAELCSRAIVLRSEAKFAGAVPEALRAYRNLMKKPADLSADDDWFQFESVRMDLPEGADGGLLASGSSVSIDIEARTKLQLSSLMLGIAVRRTADDSIVFNANFPWHELGGVRVAADKVTVRLDVALNLARGHYSLELHTFDPVHRKDAEPHSVIGDINMTESVTYEGSAWLPVTFQEVP